MAVMAAVAAGTEADQPQANDQKQAVESDAPREPSGVRRSRRIGLRSQFFGTHVFSSGPGTHIGVYAADASAAFPEGKVA
jgi:hypothetical protein